MKKRLIISLTILVILAFTTVFFLTRCGVGNVSKVEITEWKPSEIYSDKDIEDAMQTVKDYFSAEFYGCTLTKLYYSGDNNIDEIKNYAEAYDADEAIVLYSSFHVDYTDRGSILQSNETYNDYNWVLVRDKGGAWKHRDHGY